MILQKQQCEGTPMLKGLLRLAVTVAVGLGITGAASPTWAQAFPDKPIRFFVPFPAGGSMDAVARAMQPALEKIFRQPVVVENRSGAGGIDRKSTRLNSSHIQKSRMPSSA